MNKLLVHHQNSILIENRFFKKEEQFYFDIDSDISDVDFYISEQLLSGDLGKKIKSADLIFIKVALSANYLEYAGIRLAYHIRLTKELGTQSSLPIIFVAEESYQFLGLTSELPQILFSNGIYLIKDNPEEFTKYIKLYENSKIKPLGDFKFFLSKQKISPPSNYQSHHSIANEWSLLRWSEILSVNGNDAILAVKQNIQSLLYYKYLLAKNPIENENHLKITNLENAGKVLYIDDEWDKGWDVILQHVFNTIAKHHDYQSLKISFKGAEPEHIIKSCEDAVKKIDPDIIILDLRLCDIDFKLTTKTKQLTGYKLLKLIKNFNPGIQVIIFSATNKVWNFIETQNAEADGFVLKDSPENDIEGANVSESITKFINAVTIATNRKFIKDLVNICNKILINLNKTYIDENTDYKNFINTLKSKIKTCLSALTMINLKKASTIDIAFLCFYNFLESFTKYYIVYNKKDYVYYIGIESEVLNTYSYTNNNFINDGKFIKERYEPSWSISLKGIFIDYFKISIHPHHDIRDLEIIQKLRNDYIHSTKTEFKISELICIVQLCEKSCSNLKD